jgi:methylated-DNA-[protein]-cysteine S-methyltransferase
MAQKLGDKKLSRNIVFLCGKNPIPIIIPCHRIVSANGIGGYSAGLNIKPYLLKLEAQA